MWDFCNTLFHKEKTAALPNLGAENEVSTTADMWLGGYIFFMQPFVTVHFPAR